MSDISARKDELRSLVRTARRARPPAGRIEAAAGLARLVEAIPDFATARTFTAYASFGTEPGTESLLAVLLGAGKRVLLPAVHDDGTLGWIDYRGPESLALTDRGIPEPVGDEIGTGATALQAAGVDVMLIPALAVDECGARIGKGGGFYDRVLRDLPLDRPLRVAVVHDDDLFPPGTVPTGNGDQPVVAVLTPTRVCHCVATGMHAPPG